MFKRKGKKKRVYSHTRTVLIKCTGRFYYVSRKKHLRMTTTRFHGEPAPNAYEYFHTNLHGLLNIGMIVLRGNESELMHNLYGVRVIQ